MLNLSRVSSPAILTSHSPNALMPQCHCAFRGSLEGALPAHKEPGVYDEIYREPLGLAEAEA